MGALSWVAWLSGHTQARDQCDGPRLFRQLLSWRMEACVQGPALHRSGVCVGRQMVVLGKSLGGAVSLHLAADNPSRFKAVIVENTFISIEEVAPKVTLTHPDVVRPAQQSACLCPVGLKLGRVTGCVTPVPR